MNSRSKGRLPKVEQTFLSAAFLPPAQTGMSVLHLSGLTPEEIAIVEGSAK